MKETSPESFELPPEIIREIFIRLPDKSIAGLIKELKESAATKFKTFQIPVDWMLETITVVDSQVPVGRA
ncbi:hypothetical protein Bca52824_040573 [Brassica carinata]|uniref:F-box domain-containing protein n=1 Tax=Brassica carinata TaxID=52824 RepID=A0A8X7RY18_BRACI|nr:hypothetical protein Bca52824_040573 [Brassica carinata]